MSRRGEEKGHEGRGEERGEERRGERTEEGRGDRKRKWGRSKSKNQQEQQRDDLWFIMETHILKLMLV